ncbi:MAG: YdiU family protein [Peptococcaceae bacterium]|nr:YdiU family protein [Peptococcaceae bacterium]
MASCDRAQGAAWHLENTYASLPTTFYSHVKPTRVRAPQVVVRNNALGASLGQDMNDLEGERGAATFAGNLLPEGAKPLAQAYAGHQFGHFTMLGDGRAVLLGELVTPLGCRLDIQLKGAGRTPYSRGGDGRATLGPMLREYIMSEAMQALGVPTSRSLAVVTTGETVFRDTPLPGAILTRVAASHIRVGTFQYAAHYCSPAELKSLADYTIRRHFAEIAKTEGSYLSFLQAVIKRQAELIAKWQLVGFVHGVMNTDNMAVSGETIDYGPCAFMDNYDPATVFSSIDQNGRYAYGHQPRIAAWNLARLAETFLPLLHHSEEEAVGIANDVIGHFPVLYKQAWLSGMRGKLGIFNEEEADLLLAEDLLALMQEQNADYTNIFLALTLDERSEMEFFSSTVSLAWQARWQERLRRQPQSGPKIKQLMQACNPVVIPRNHRVEESLFAAVTHQDYSLFENLLAALSAPFTADPKYSHYRAAPSPSSHPYKTFCGT